MRRKNIQKKIWKNKQEVKQNAQDLSSPYQRVPQEIMVCEVCSFHKKKLYIPYLSSGTNDEQELD